MRPLGSWGAVSRGFKTHEFGRHSLYTVFSPPKEKIPFPKNLPPQFLCQIPNLHRPDKQVGRKIIVPPPPESKCRAFKDPISAFTKDQLAIYDPTGERKALFDRRNPHGVKVGDILRVTFKSGDPFAGVCLNIRSRGLDTSFLLRNKLTRIGCEMWIKVFSPNVQSVEIVQRTEKRKRRARLYYMRHPKHDMGSVEGIVRQYLRSRLQQRGSTR
ncbi:ribosomal protein L19 [Paracoccidioides brasiliensis Pb18]|uniref:Ribosomal protein L19 n=2 Tax=Paracoccidioides brasiliensis TaxID=121759 RepID=C1GJQ3_PARBD|nr:ribosomal protein L19 [Paracoccidioides brasiliensis Pb18]EEH42669.1 ribosomal protein L19 [Paracoccidioides brasiliensis Pb18]ODH41586.1 ribosomal protein L19 [Paracoccidioides brasiliensis]ODH51059.1 ribosomal protein L19 [Paracoccidioides brasiliensis]